MGSQRFNHMAFPGVVETSTIDPKVGDRIIVFFSRGLKNLSGTIMSIRGIPVLVYKIDLDIGESVYLYRHHFRLFGELPWTSKTPEPEDHTFDSLFEGME